MTLYAVNKSLESVCGSMESESKYSFFRILHFHTNYSSVPTKRDERGVIIIGGSEVTSGSKPVRGAIQGQK